MSVLTLVKCFGLNTSRISGVTIARSAPLIGYSLIWCAIYPLVWSLRLHSEDSQSVESVNLMVINLQLVCVIVTYYSTIIWCGWMNSKRFVKFLLNLNLFDRRLSQNFAQKSRRCFIYFVLLATTYFLLFILIDLIVNCFLNDNVYSILHWLTVVVPSILTYYSVVSSIFSSFLLYRRFDCLRKSIDKLMVDSMVSDVTSLKSANRQKDAIQLKKFTNLYDVLVDCGADLIWCFSPTFLFLFLLSFMMILNNVFLVLKVENLQIYDYVTSINAIVFQLVQIVSLVIAFHATKLKADSVVTSAHSLIIGDGMTSREMIDCIDFMDKKRFSVKIFWIFGLEPNTLLSIGVSIVTFLVILIQFSPDFLPKERTAPSRSTTG